MQSLSLKCTHNYKFCTHPKMVSKFWITPKQKNRSLRSVFLFGAEAIGRRTRAAYRRRKAKSEEESTCGILRHTAHRPPPGTKAERPSLRIPRVATDSFSHQKMTVILIQNCSHFFIHYGVMVYHHATCLRAYHQKERENRSFLHIITL